MSESILELEKILGEVTKSFDSTTSKKMFGCQAMWVNGNVFSLVWKTGRLAVKLPEESAYDSLMAVKGSEPWVAGTREMAHWVLVPETFHSKKADIKKWALKAHELCKAIETKPKKTAAVKSKTKKAKKHV